MELIRSRRSAAVTVDGEVCSVRAAQAAVRASTAATVTGLPRPKAIAALPADDRNRLRQLTIRGVSFTALSFDQLAALLGSRTRASAARRWLYRGGAVPSELPARIPGVKPSA